MPRKKKAEKYLYKNIVSMKVTDMELEILNRHAATAGLSRSAYLRELFLSNEIHVHYEIVADMKILRDILKEYGKKDTFIRCTYLNMKISFMSLPFVN